MKELAFNMVRFAAFTMVIVLHGCVSLSAEDDINKWTAHKAASNEYEVSYKLPPRAKFIVAPNSKIAENYTSDFTTIVAAGYDFHSIRYYPSKFEISIDDVKYLQSFEQHPTFSDLSKYFNDAHNRRAEISLTKLDELDALKIEYNDVSMIYSYIVPINNERFLVFRGRLNNFIGKLLDTKNEWVRSRINLFGKFIQTVDIKLKSSP